MTSLSDKSFQRERRRRPASRPRRRTQTPWGLYIGAWLGIAVAVFVAQQTHTTWPRWAIAGVVVALLLWLAWDMLRERHGT